MDVLRNFGRAARLSKFLGLGADVGYQSPIAALAVTAGYSEAELTEMVNELPRPKFGDLGPLILQDVDADVAGINGYITSLTGANAAKIPTEYALLKTGGYPPPYFNRNDVVASAILVQSLFAVGGGSENVTKRARPFLQQHRLQLHRRQPESAGRRLPSCARMTCATPTIRRPRAPSAPLSHQSPASVDSTSPSMPADTCHEAGAAIWDVGSYQVFDAYDADGTNAENLPLSADDRDRSQRGQRPQNSSGWTHW